MAIDSRCCRRRTCRIGRGERCRDDAAKRGTAPVVAVGNSCLIDSNTGRWNGCGTGSEADGAQVNRRLVEKDLNRRGTRNGSCLCIDGDIEGGWHYRKSFIVNASAAAIHKNGGNKNKYESSEDGDEFPFHHSERRYQLHGEILAFAFVKHDGVKPQITPIVSGDVGVVNSGLGTLFCDCK